MNHRAMVAGLLAGTAWLAASGTSRADEDPRRTALIEGAMRAATQGEHARALQLAIAASALRETPSLARLVAEEHEHLRHIPEAVNAARRCVALAEKEPPSENQRAVLVGCRDILKDHRLEVAILAVRSPSAPPSLVITVGGAARDAGGGTYAVAPGKVLVEARAPGWQTFSKTLDVVGGSEAEVVVALEPEPSRAVAVQPPAALRSDPPPSRGGRWVAPSLVAVGGVALATGAVMALISDGNYNDLRRTCTGGCANGASDKSTIQTLDNVALGLAIGGAVVAGVGATLFFIRGRDHRESARVVVHPGGVSLRGSF